MKDVVLITLAVFSASFGFKGFLLTNHFIDGGVTGISLLISLLSGVPLYLLVICINLPFVLLGYKVVGKHFAFKTALAITALAVCLASIHFPNVTNDNLLGSCFRWILFRCRYRYGHSWWCSYRWYRDIGHLPESETGGNHWRILLLRVNVTHFSGRCIFFEYRNGALFHGHLFCGIKKLSILL